MLNKESVVEKRRTSRLISRRGASFDQDCRKTKKIALFGGETNTTESIKGLLLKNSYEVVSCLSFEDLLFAASGHDFDVLLLNCDEQVDYREVLAFVSRSLLPTTPIFVLSNQTDLCSTLPGQYSDRFHVMGKQWQSFELVLQLKSFIRRSKSVSTVGRTKATSANAKMVRLRRPIQAAASLSDKELLVANSLFAHANDYVSRESLASIAWSSKPIESRVVDATVCRVRKKLNLTRSNGYHLISIYGFGYSLNILKE